jgi:hypothetical protein
MQRAIGDPLALALLEGEYLDGDTVTVEVDGPTAQAPGADATAVGGLVLR